MSAGKRTAAGGVLIALAAWGQPPASGPRFETAAVRLATITMSGVMRGERRRIDASRVEFLGSSLPQLIRTAYRLQPYQNVEGPDWIKRRYFDVFAKLPEGATRNQIPEMLQALLADQLKLVMRRENREQLVCLLTVGKNGPKLKAVADDAHPEPPESYKDGRVPVRRTKSPDGFLTYYRLHGTIILEATKITLPDLAILLRREINMPVLDRTGLRGFYEVSLFVPGLTMRQPSSRAGLEDSFQPPASEGSPVPVASDPEGVSLYKSIQRLGLKLVKTKAPIEHIVVESAEQNPEER